MIKKIIVLVGVIVTFSFILASCDFQKGEEISKEETISKEEKIPKDSKSQTEKEKYISFTLTRQEDEGLKSYTYTYDLKEEKLTKRVQLDYYAQYPLAVYSAFDDSVYYSYRDDEGCDQLWKIDLKSKKKECLTTSIFAINYIIPIKDKLYIAAVKSKERAIGLFEYSHKKLTRISKNKDDFVWRVRVNPDIDKIAYNTYSQSELDKNMEEGDGSGDGIGINTIHVLDLNTNQVKTAGKAPKGYITDLGIDSNENIYYSLGKFYKVGEEKAPDEEWMNLDIYALIYMSNDEIYYLDGEGRLDKYDKVSKENTILYELETEQEAINNAIILYK